MSTSSPASGFDHTILITGTTGGLGAHVLEHLLKSHLSTRVFALNRKHSSGDSASQRQSSAFASRGLDTGLLTSSRLRLLTANTLDELSQEVRDELVSSLTHILHLSYPVNFNLTLASFEPSIQFTQSLLELTAQVNSAKPDQKPNFVFASSVATLANYPGPKDEWVPEESVELSSCLGGGYGESKRVCEDIIEAYVKTHGFSAVILRIGQICGNRQHGAWNLSEWFPLIVQSGLTLGCLPDGVDDVAWIPVDEAAVAVTELSFQPRSVVKPFVYRHVIHPRATAWHNLISPIATWMTTTYKPSAPIRLVTYSEWYDRLSKKAEAGQTVGLGAAKLLEFFSHHLKEGGLHSEPQIGSEAMGVKRLVTTQSEAESSRLSTCSPLSETDAIGWLTYWKKMGHFDQKV